MEKSSHVCPSLRNKNTDIPLIRNVIRSQNLNKCQKDAVLSSVEVRKCHYNHTVKLIWGPPGTGKTKTVVSMLFCLLRLKTRTLTCAPTNIAVLEVASRLRSLVEDQLQFDTYGLGDIVLFGNNSRMKVDDYLGLPDIFLEYRIDRLAQCLDPLTGWRPHLESMINLLEKPHDLFLLANIDAKYEEANDLLSLEEFARLHYSIIEQVYLSYKKLEDKGDHMTLNQFVKKRYSFIEDQYLSYKAEVQFIKRKFSFIGENLKSCLQILYSQLPTSIVPFDVAKKIRRALDLLETLQNRMRRNEFIEIPNYNVNGKGKSVYVPIKPIQDSLVHMRTEILIRDITFCFGGRLRLERDEFLGILRSLTQTISLPKLKNYYAISKFCLKEACLIFCTASGSTKLFTVKKAPIPFVVIDEAAQLRECESTIPLQLPGVRHAILIGDERQLPALVKSKVVHFSLSLFNMFMVIYLTALYLNSSVFLGKLIFSPCCFTMFLVRCLYIYLFY